DGSGVPDPVAGSWVPTPQGEGASSPATVQEYVPGSCLSPLFGPNRRVCLLSRGVGGSGSGGVPAMGGGGSAPGRAGEDRARAEGSHAPVPSQHMTPISGCTCWHSTAGCTAASLPATCAPAPWGVGSSHDRHRHRTSSP